MYNIRQIIEQIKEISQWKGYVNKERFVSYVKAKDPITDKQAEDLWKVWNCFMDWNWYQLDNIQDAMVDEAMYIAREVYESVCCGAHVHYREHKPQTVKWKVYYRIGEEGEIMHIELNLLDKEDVIKYAHLLQQEGVEILHRLDFYKTIVSRVRNVNDEYAKMDIYEGDIIFCTDADRFSWKDDSGAYLCTDRCFKRMMYTPGRGYLRRGEPDFEQNNNGEDIRYNDYVFNAYEKHFQVVGNIYVDNSVLSEQGKEGAK